MQEASSSTNNYTNLLETPTLLEAFQKHPPIDFDVKCSPQGIFSFNIPFNLLTTMEPEERKKIQRYPLFNWWKKYLTFRSCFIGTTVTEYNPLPNDLSATELLTHLKEHYTPKQTLTILKDLPKNSPLLSKENNEHAAQLIKQGKKDGFIEVEGQALAYVPIDFTSINEYLNRLSPSRRKDIKRKLKIRNHLRLEILNTGDKQFNNETWLKQLYNLYFNVYLQSEIHFDLLSEDFFKTLLQDKKSKGKVFLYWLEDTLIGYNICYIEQNYLIDKYIGLQYPCARQYNLYFISWIENLKYALTHGLQYYVAGWTDPKVKASLGAKFTFTCHLVWVRDPILRGILKKFRPLFESDKQILGKQ